MKKDENKQRNNSENVKGHEWKPGQSGNPNGRPKKIYTILKEKGFSKDDIKTAFHELAFYTEKELRSMSKDKTKPIITRIAAKQFLTAYDKGNWGAIKEILEHNIGRPTGTENLRISDPEGNPVKFYNVEIPNNGRDKKEKE